MVSSGYEADVLEFDLRGNPTTGYLWQISNENSKKTKSEVSYIADENEEGLTGVGGTYHFKVKGLKEGSCVIECEYVRPFEGTPIEKVTYKLYVSDENKITVIARTKEITE